MSRYRATMAELLKQVKGININEAVDDHEISMARGELEAIADKATQLASMLQGKSDEGNPLEAWVQSKITKAKDYINSVSDYMMYKPEEVKEATGTDIIKKHSQWKLQPGGGMYPRYKHPKHGEINIDRYGGWMHYDKNNKRVAFYSPAYPDNKLSNTGATSMDFSDYFKLKKLDEELEEGIMSNIATLKSEFQRLDTDYKKMKDEYNAIMAGAYKGDESTVEKKMFKALRSLKDVRQELTIALKTVKEEVEVNEENEYVAIHLKKGKTSVTANSSYEAAKKASEKFGLKNTVGVTVYLTKKDVKEETLEEGFSSTLKAKAKDIAKKLAGNMTKAYAEIEKIAKGLSKDAEVQKALRMANEELDLEESKIKDIFTANKEGQSLEQIAKRLNMSVATVKKVLGEELIDEKIADSIIKDLQKSYGDLKGKTISTDMANRISKHLDGQSFDVITLRQLMKADIPFISTLAKNKIYKKTGKFESLEEQDDVKKPEGESDIEGLKKQLVTAQGQINMLKQKLENEKNKAIKPEPNPETGEVPLTVGVAYKYFKDKEEKNKETKKEAFDNYPTSDINKKKPIHSGAKMTYETIQGLKNKADKTGMPYGILKKVYDRGMAAWRGGHRPGASQQQWAFARVNSFVTKSSGTWGGADKDLAKQVKGSKK
jgi:hypothetical protein